MTALSNNVRINNGGHRFKSIAEKLLQKTLPDHEGTHGGLHYSLTRMRTIDVQLPRIALLSEAVYANNGAFSICGDYNFFFNGLINFTGKGEFRISVSDITVCLARHADVIRQDSLETMQAIGDHRPFLRDVRSHGKVLCRIGRIKPQFHGGSANLCQTICQLLMKIYRPKIEQMVSEIIFDMMKENEAKTSFVISGLAILTDPVCAEETRTDRWMRNMTESKRQSEEGRIRRFLNNIRVRVGTSRENRSAS